ncbi:hypothetical protein BDD12DRAFT_891835 [Trichophaea hybrida]|nr:hypothetical protein BDD12DRAFT_891835 [Trichophaea hybrida]
MGKKDEKKRSAKEERCVEDVARIVGKMQDCNEGRKHGSDNRKMRYIFEDDNKRKMYTVDDTDEKRYNRVERYGVNDNKKRLFGVNHDEKRYNRVKRHGIDDENKSRYGIRDGECDNDAIQVELQGSIIWRPKRVTHTLGLCWMKRRKLLR